MKLFTWLKSCLRRSDKAEQQYTVLNLDGKVLARVYTVNLEKYEEFLPDPPRVIMAYRENYDAFIDLRGYPPREGDTALRSLFRIYEHLVLNRIIDLRNELERFWYQRWPVASIPEPQDVDEETKAVLALAADFLVKSFNWRIDKGLPRHAPSIMPQVDIDRFKDEPRIHETLPPWAQATPPLPKTLVIPYWSRSRELISLESFEAPYTSRQAKARNILMEQPHILFM